MTRDEAIIVLKNAAWLGSDTERDRTEQAVGIAVKSLQADSVPVAHGHWYDVGSLSCRCSGCECKSNKESAYCPNCGAKMDGKDDDNEQTD